VIPYGSLSGRALASEVYLAMERTRFRRLIRAVLANLVRVSADSESVAGLMDGRLAQRAMADRMFRLGPWNCPKCGEPFPEAISKFSTQAS
jgi:hypothetical protein